MTGPRVILTRPAGQSAQWLQVLQAQGLAACSFPLIEIGDALAPAQRVALHARAAQTAVCMWVSANAVDYFFKPKVPVAQGNAKHKAIKNIALTHSLPALGGQRHWATGPGTVAALLQHGLPSTQIDAPDPQAAQWDTEALWLRVHSQIQSGMAVLILRGEDIGTPSASRDWLAAQVRAAGGTVEFAAVYQRRAPQWSAAQAAWAQAAALDASVWVFSSSQALTHLPGVGSGWGQARCVATHPRIAQAAHTAGFGVVCTSRPEPSEVVQSIKSLL